MRVFSVFFHPNPAVTAVGGAEKRFIEMVKYFCKHNVQITVVEPQSTLPTEFGACLKRHFLSSPSFVGKGWVTLYFSWVLWTIKACGYSSKIIKKGEFNVILAPNNTLPNLLSAYIIHIMSHLPICVVVHHLDVLTPKYRQNFLTTYNTYRKVGYGKISSLIKTFAFVCTLQILKRADACITVSKTTAKTLIHNGVMENKIFLSGNSVTQKNYAKKNNSRKLYDGIFVGRIAKEKGIYDLIQVWRKIVQLKKESKLVIIGSGPELSNLRKEVEKASLERNVFLKGGLKEEELYELMSESRVFVFPSIFEGWGLAIAEALACGLPVVCYAMPAVSEIFGECKSAFFVPPWNVESLTEKVLKIIFTSEKEYRKLSLASRTFVRRFDWVHVFERDLQVLRRVAGFWRRC